MLAPGTMASLNRRNPPDQSECSYIHIRSKFKKENVRELERQIREEPTHSLGIPHPHPIESNGAPTVVSCSVNAISQKGRPLGGGERRQKQRRLTPKRHTRPGTKMLASDGSASAFSASTSANCARKLRTSSSNAESSIFLER